VVVVASRTVEKAADMYDIDVRIWRCSVSCSNPNRGRVWCFLMFPPIMTESNTLNGKSGDGMVHRDQLMTTSIVHCISLTHPYH